MRKTIRPLYYYLLLYSLFLLGMSFVLQFQFQQIPCPLCIIDRIIVFTMIIFFIVALWHNPKLAVQKIYSVVGFLLAFLGILSSGRHLWLINLPSELVPGCGPGIDYLFGTLPLKDALFEILQGSGECALNSSHFLGLPIPGWTMFSFTVLALGSLLPWWGKK
ncbi:MAG: disulfide bond formation protein B [Proteobacteria bacterium]|nr:disulfide bond formation protein B [Pseudomonadota bacterium]